MKKTVRLVLLRLKNILRAATVLFTLKELPKTAVLFYMRGGEEYTCKNYDTVKLSDKFPRFLNACPVYRFCNHDVCFLDGGRGAPQAADTIETLGALGVENVVAVGMFGAFSDDIEHGSIIVPSKAFVEEELLFIIIPKLIILSLTANCATRR